MPTNKRRRYEISDEDYERIKPLLPGKPGDLGRNADNNRRFINAVLWIARTGAPWDDLPERYGKANTAFQRFNRWAKKGRWQGIFEALQDPDLEWLRLDTTVVRAHQHAAGQKKARPSGRPSGAPEAASRPRCTPSSMPSVTP